MTPLPMVVSIQYDYFTPLYGYDHHMDNIVSVYSPDIDFLLVVIVSAFILDAVIHRWRK